MVGRTISHYRVLEQVGAGGMGVVYRAHDLQLDRDVALKVLPPGTLSDEAARRRFRKEALALARLNHPNVGGIYEFGTEEGCDFLVMEFVSGLGLDTLIAAGPLDPAEVLRLGAQLADGLQAAHAQGLVHRDLKPGNLRLSTDGRLKILDFGLAEWTNLATDDAATITLTGPQYAQGTLPYMSPEQLRGKAVDARSDLYSVGVVLYEMLTGRRPFAASTGPQLVSAILESPPSPPTSQGRDIPDSMDVIVLKALDKDPDRRYQSAKELRIDLERIASGAGTLVKPSRTRVFLTAAVFVALILAALAFNPGNWRQKLFSSQHAGRVPAKHARRSVAVLGFTNLSGKPESAWISTALSEMLATELAAGEELRVVPGENVAKMKLDLTLKDTDSFGRETLQRIHRLLGSDLVILGSYVALGKESKGKIRLDYRLQDAAAGETIASISQTGTEDELLEIVSRSGAELRQKLGLHGVSNSEAATVRASLPANLEAARLYSQGLAKLRVFENIEARDLLQKAVLQDPTHAPTHSALASAWSELGYDLKAQKEAKQALDLSSNLSREERLAIEGRYHELMREWPKAIDLYRSLWAFFPDNLEYGLLLAFAQIASGSGKEALETLDSCRRLAPGDPTDARIDLAEAKAADSLGNFKQEQAAAERAIAAARAEGNRLLLAQALLTQGWALLRMGNPSTANAAFLQAKDLFFAAGDQRGTGNALIFLGEVLYDQGDFGGARKTYEEARLTFRATGAQQNLARALNNIGNVLYEEGKLAEAKSYYEQTLAIYREIDSKRGLAGALGNLANVMDSMGDLAATRQMQEQALAAFRDVGDKRGTASTLDNLGNVLVELGDLSRARTCYEEALGIFEQISFKRGKSFALGSLGGVLALQGDLEAGRRHMEEGLAIREELNEQDLAAQSRTQISGIALEQGRFAEGEALSRRAVAQFAQDKAADSEAWASAVLAKNLLGQRNLAEARRVSDRAVALSLRSGSRYPRFEAMLAQARVLAASGDTFQAAAKAEAVRSEANKYGYVVYELEAHLLLGEIEVNSRNRSSGQARLSALEKDANSKGFRLVAQKANRVLQNAGPKADSTQIQSRNTRQV